MLLDTPPAPAAMPHDVSSAAPAFLAQRSAAPATTVQSFWTPQRKTDPESLSYDDVRGIIEDWVAAAKSRDVEKIVSLYDQKVGRLLGTVDDSSSPRRTSRAMIKEYFNHFLGDNEKVEPIFPRFTERDVQFIDDKTAVYSGYYTCELTPKGGNTKIANAKFTYIVHRTKEAGVQLVLHNSGLTPAGVVMK